MKINELFEDGIITAYNTTVDVKPGETERQAKKFFGGNGKPLPLGAKGATSNQAFNLGLTENMSVTGTERRRLEKKKGIEVGTPEWFKHWFDLPYLREDITKQELLAKLKDQQRARYIKAMLDAMHQLVQSKGARHSLGNYAYEIAKTFGYSPKELEKMYRDMYISEVNEAFDNPYPFKLTGPDESQSFVATAQTPNGPLRMDFETTDYDNFGIDFAVGKSMGKTEAGDEFRVFATVVAMMNKWISTVGIKHVESFDFGANKGEHASDGRAKLYTRFAKKLASQLGWKLEQSTTQDRSTAFFKLTNPKPVPRDDEYWDALDEDVTQPQLNALEKAVDNVFGRIGIDVEFTRHFLDRANDERNGEPITIQELGKLFAKEYKRWGKPIAQMGPDTEAVMKDLESDINIPFALRWNGEELELIAKTVMRKKNFSTSNKQFPVENTQGSLAQQINWGGQNKPTDKKPVKKPAASKQQDTSWWQRLQQRAFNETDVAENFADGKKKVNEVLDNPAPYTWRKNEFGFPTAEAKELGLHISFDGRNQPQWEVSFYREQENGSIVMNRPTGQGKEFQVFATVNAAIKDFIKMHPDAEGLTLDAAKDGGVDGQGRVSL